MAGCGYNVFMVRLEQVLESWKTIRQDTISAVEDFPAAELDYRATPELMTFREIARHILDASHGLTGMLLAGEVDFATPDFRQRLQRHMPDLPAQAGAPELAAALRRSIEERTAELAARPAGVLRRNHHALRRPEGHPAGDAADDQRARVDPPRRSCSFTCG